MTEEELMLGWERVGGVYRCVRDPGGSRCTPLVAYTSIGEDGQRCVGETYFNFAKVVEHQWLLDGCAELLVQRVLADYRAERFDVVVGIETDGIPLGQLVAKKMMRRFVPLLKDKSHGLAVPSGVSNLGSCLLVDDVYNQGSAFRKAIPVLKQQGMQGVAIACAANRARRKTFMEDTASYRVISATHLPEEAFERSHPAVARDVALGNVCEEPKQEWNALIECMRRAQ